MGGWQNPTSGLTGATGIDPNAPLSTLLPSPAQSYSGTVVPGVSSKSKQQYLADILNTSGTNTIGAGTSLLGKPLDYYANLLKPPTRESLTEQQGPAISSVIGQYETGKKAVSQQPRGGGTAATLANLPFEESGAITGLLENALTNYLNVLQPQGAAGITNIAGLLANLGTTETGQGANTLQNLEANAVARSAQNKALISQIIAGGLGAGGQIGAAAAQPGPPPIAG